MASRITTETTVKCCACWKRVEFKSVSLSAPMKGEGWFISTNEHGVCIVESLPDGLDAELYACSKECVAKLMDEALENARAKKVIARVAGEEKESIEQYNKGVGGVYQYAAPTPANVLIPKSKVWRP
jgi:hypothetical protein